MPGARAMGRLASRPISAEPMAAERQVATKAMGKLAINPIANDPRAAATQVATKAAPGSMPAVARMAGLTTTT